MFKQAFQLQGTDPNKSHKIGGTTIALPSLSWYATQVLQMGYILSLCLFRLFEFPSRNVNEFQLVGSGENEAVEFVIESQSDIVPVFSFGVHLAVAANFMKFNVTIDKMKDKWNDKANFFTLCYQIQESDSSLSSSTIFQSNYNTISIGSHGEAFFSIEQFAVETSTGAQRRVILNSNVTDSWICNHYERFDNRLTHDPTFGFQNTANNSGAVVWIVLGLLLSFITVVSIIVLVLVYVVIRQRGGNYQEL